MCGIGLSDITLNVMIAFANLIHCHSCSFWISILCVSGFRMGFTDSAVDDREEICIRRYLFDVSATAKSLVAIIRVQTEKNFKSETPFLDAFLKNRTAVL